MSLCEPTQCPEQCALLARQRGPLFKRLQSNSCELCQPLLVDNAIRALACYYSRLSEPEQNRHMVRRRCRQAEAAAHELPMECLLRRPLVPCAYRLDGFEHLDAVAVAKDAPGKCHVSSFIIGCAEQVLSELGQGVAR